MSDLSTARDLAARLNLLQELYDSLPTIACKGLCANSCGPIDMSEIERRRITALGVTIPLFSEERAARWSAQEPLHCPALNRRTLRCDVYEARPLVCRMWGVTETMQCENGCVPTRLLTIREQFTLMLKAIEIGGHRNIDAQTGLENMGAMLDHPKIGPLMERFLHDDRDVQPELIAAIGEYRQEKGF